MLSILSCVCWQSVYLPWRNVYLGLLLIVLCWPQMDVTEYVSILFIYLLIFYFWLCWVFVAACGLSLVAASGGNSSLWCTGFSLSWLLLLRSMSSRSVGFSSSGSGALERRLSSCGARALLLRSTWDLPRPGLEPVFPALAGGFLTTAPPGKSSILFQRVEQAEQYTLWASLLWTEHISHYLETIWTKF